MSTPKEIIENIRKEFGIDKELDDEAKKIINNQHEMLARAIKQLSVDLYSKEIHFVMELIQNADDNEYTVKEPFIRFIIEQDKILVQNNENGFSEKHVQALCDVANSTKTKKMGYIGEKGIGFKSVFRISHTPQIFSNGFRFELRGNDKEFPLSYIVPYWIENVPNYVDLDLTNIVLPLREDISEDFFKKFQELDPTLILFLRKLKRIEIHNIINQTMDKIILKEENGIRIIQYNNIKKNYKVIKQVLSVPKEVREDKRSEVEETELVLAFPLDEKGDAKTDEEQKVFVFLPTRSYGFKFLIQGDFLVTANREEIHKDKKWNIWLRDSIADVLIKSIEEFKKDEKLSKSYYNYLPAKKEITDPFFSELVDKIYDKLKQEECILSASNQWRKPQDLYIGDKEIRNIVSNDDLRKFFNKEYILDKLSIPEEVLKHLEIPQFDIDKLIELLQNTDWLQGQPDEWFVKLYAYLNKKLNDDQQLKTIKELKIIRLENRQLTSIQEDVVFLPLDKRTTYGFEKDLRVIKRETIQPEEDEKEQKKAINDFLKKLGVKNASPYDIIENHILKIYDDGSFKNKSKEKRIGYIRYIKDHLDDYEKGFNEELKKRYYYSYYDYSNKKPLDRLKKSLYLKSYQLIDNKEEYKKPNEIYLSKEYGNKNHLEKLFKNIEDIYFIHNEYIEDILETYKKFKRYKDKKNYIKEKSKEIKEWQEFFIKIGVNEILRIQETENHDLTTQDLERLRKGEKGNLEWFRNFESEDLEKLLQKINKERSKYLLKHLDSNWEKLKEYKKFIYEWSYRSGAKSKSNNDYDANWILLLKNSSWIYNSKSSFSKPLEVFLDKKEIRDLLGDSVHYVNIEIKNKDLIESLGINTQAKVDVVLNYLKVLVKNQHKDLEIYKNLYKFLCKNFDKESERIVDSFRENAIIYVSDSKKLYHNSKEVIWKDMSIIFGQHKAYLEKHYSELRSFFVDQLKVNENAHPKDYADVLLKMSESKERLTQEQEQKLWKIYQELNRYLNPSETESLISREDWWENFIKNIKLWSNKNEWQSTDFIYINDNKEFYELFKNKIHFVKLPDDDYHRISFFLKSIKIPYLSKSVKMQLINDEKGTYEEELTQTIRKFMPYIVRNLYNSNHNHYQLLKTEGILQKFFLIECYSYNRLQVKLNLGNYSVDTQRDILLVGNKLYIKKDRIDDTELIAMELGKQLSENDFITLLFLKKDDSKIEEYLKKKEIPELPLHEQLELKEFLIKDKSNVEKERMNQNNEIEEEMEIHYDESGIQESEYQINTKTRETQSQNRYSIGGSNRFDRKFNLNNLTTIIKGNSEEKIQQEINESFEQNQETTDWTPSVSPQQVEAVIEDYQIKEKHYEYREHSSSEFYKHSHDKTIEKKKRDLSSEGKKRVGRWGEEFVFDYLKKEYMKNFQYAEFRETKDGFEFIHENQILAKVIWANKDRDTGEGYDFIIEENQTKKYIEVKSSVEESKEWFDLSEKQWQFLKQNGQNFYIYRVYNAGTNKAKIQKIYEIYKLWLENKITAYPIRIKL